LKSSVRYGKHEEEKIKERGEIKVERYNEDKNFRRRHRHHKTQKHFYNVLTKVPVGLLFVFGKASSDMVSTASNKAYFERKEQDRINVERKGKRRQNAT
jgi:hypothetical protein